MNKFSNVPADDDTAILFSLEVKLGERDILYQKWSLVCDGITAESFIFINGDVANLTDAELEEEARISPMIKSDSSITIKRSDSGFTFVNFNFVIDSDDESEPEVLTPDELEQKRAKARAAIGANNKATVERLKQLNRN